MKSHWEQDDAGQWWWITRWARNRGVESTCHRCERAFPHLPSKGRRFCSIDCANNRADIEIVGTIEGERGKPRWGQAANGTWWELREGKRWTRAITKKCEICDAEYAARKRQPGRARRTCSRECAAQLPRRAKTGPEAHGWRGGTTMQYGYRCIYMPDHPACKNSATRKYVQEHRLVMEQTLGRYLKPHERVHHINGDKLDNRPENLELWAGSHPSGQRKGEGKPHCPTCNCFTHGDNLTKGA